MTEAGAEQLACATPLSGHVRLLPAFDVYVLAPHGHRRHAWPEGLHSRISRAAGWISPVLLVDGRIAGVWSQAGSGSGFRIGIEAFAPLPRRTRAAAEGHARTYEALLGGPVEVTWLDPATG